MTDSSITIYEDHAISFDGPDATELYRAICLRGAIKLASKGIQATRGMTLTRCLKMAPRYTGRQYKRTESAQALADLTVWIETMKSAIPVRSL